MQRLLGSGELADVFLALDRKSRSSRVALKLLRPEAKKRGGSERLRQEFETLAGIRHASLPQPLEFFPSCRDPFFTMELIEGPDFVRWVRSDVPPARNVAGVAWRQEFRACTAEGILRLRRGLSQLISVLGVLHVAGRVHADLQPGNVLVAYGDRVVLIDHGLSCPSSASPSPLSLEPGPGTVAVASALTSQPIGTAAYMAPEQCSGEPHQPAGDWYGLGLLLFQALTGSLPYVGAAPEVMVRKRTLPAPSPGALVPAVPADLDDLCVRLLAIDPMRRPQFAELNALPMAPIALSR